jgi:dTDP-4-amino-4,6-dideoxygalactose transaminase
VLGKKNKKYLIKKDIKNFAIFGGLPSFSKKMHVGLPNIGNRRQLLKRINRILDNKWLTNNGYYVQELEKSIARRLKVKHCIAVCNATIGLEIAIRALNLKGEVIIPAFTFIAPVHALQWLGVKPVFCDVEPASHNIDPFQVERLLSPQTTGILGVHLWGRACDIDRLTDIAQKNNLKILFDAAHAFDCSYKGRMLGNFGDAEVFSFHATKYFNTFEGGAIVTNDDELAKKIRLMKNFGFSGNVLSLGINGKMNEVSAAMGLTGLEVIEDLKLANYRNYKYYQNELKDIPGVFLLAYDETEKCNYQYIVLEIDKALTGISRDQMMNILLAENVIAKRYFHQPCYHVEPYCSFSYCRKLHLPVVEKLSSSVLVLPSGSSIGQSDIKNICQIIRLAARNSKEVRSRMRDFSRK